MATRKTMATVSDTPEDLVKRVEAHMGTATAHPRPIDCGQQEYNGRPVGMPDPDWPWPWKTEDERDKQIATPFWQARFRQCAVKYPAYKKWILGKPKGAP